ncbi:MAG: hypothetical protein HC853_02760 [Anaerolineae bacterium]|nr:hypothetical protein [Anaerolineae bacterium]
MPVITTRRAPVHPRQLAAAFFAFAFAAGAHAAAGQAGHAPHFADASAHHVRESFASGHSLVIGYWLLVIGQVTQ